MRYFCQQEMLLALQQTEYLIYLIYVDPVSLLIPHVLLHWQRYIWPVKIYSNNTCELALVCGAKLNLLPYVNFVLTKAKMLSPDGQCKTFDANANGYVQGEGVGVIVLKPLDKALKDNDRIYAVITGSAINQDGKTNGLTAPNGLQQEELLKSAHQAAKIDSHDLSYMECHGTGTFLGDPIEIQALGEVVGKKRDKQKPCWIGSVKTNIGHLEPAAGVASVIKVALALSHAKIPPHVNFSTPNPHIAFDKYHFQIPQKMEDWPRYGSHRMAGVSGFGFGGTNTHVVMRELSDQEKPVALSNDLGKTEIFTLSAKDKTALSLFIDKWCAYLEINPSLDLGQICHNMHLRRSHYFCRLAITVNSTMKLYEALCKLKNQPLESFANSENIFINLKKDKIDATKFSSGEQRRDLFSLAITYVNRANIDWKKQEEGRSYPYLDLPLYPWQHKDYWPPLVGHKLQVAPDAVIDPYPLQAKQIISPLSTLQFEFKVDSKNVPDIQDTYNILHAGYYMEIFAFTAKQLSQQPTFAIEDHAFLSPLIAPNNTIITIHVILEKLDENIFSYNFFSNTYGQKNWVHHTKGKLILTRMADKKIDSIEAIKKRCPINEPAEKLYERVIAMGMPAGESIRWTHQYWRGEKEIICEFRQPAITVEKNEIFVLGIHPGIIDASIQPIFKLLPPELVKPYIASGIKKAVFYGMKKGPFYLFGTLKSDTATEGQIIGDCYLVNQENQLIAEFVNVTLTQLDNKIQIEKIMQAKEQHKKIDLTSLPHKERQEYIINFLSEQIALIFSMPKEDIEINRSLSAMGIDSLMALVLMRTLEVGLDVTYSMQALLEGPTIAELADFVLNNVQGSSAIQASTSQSTSTENNSNVWISYRQIQSNVKARLFCFPYGGGGASIYRDWQKDLPDSVEVCPIQLPGREHRMDEKPMDNLNTIVDALIESLQPELNLPFAFFGHSFGSLIGFELARQLRKRHLPQPRHLFVSAFPDPRTPTKSLDKIIQQLQAIDINLFDMSNPASVMRLSDEKLTKLSAIFNENGIADYGNHLMNKDIVKVLLPIFSGDMSIVKNYQYRDAEPLDLPITVFGGKRDTWVSHQDHLSWAERTRVKCEIHEFDSGHLFIKEDYIKNQILQKISEALIQ